MANAPSSTAQIHQDQWNEIAGAPALERLPYKIETNRQGQIILSPHTNKHSDLQAALFQLLLRHAPEGHVSVEYALATQGGVKVPDVVWMSPSRRKAMQATGDPSTKAPEICVEVMSVSNTDAEMHEKRMLYREIGAEEVWVAASDGTLRFFGSEEQPESALAPTCPSTVELP